MSLQSEINFKNAVQPERELQREAEKTSFRRDARRPELPKGRREPAGRKARPGPAAAAREARPRWGRGLAAAPSGAQQGSSVSAGGGDEKCSLLPGKQWELLRARGLISLWGGQRCDRRSDQEAVG